MKKSLLTKPKKARMASQPIRTKYRVGPRRKNAVLNAKILSSSLTYSNSGVTKSISIHFPEGGVITLKFQLAETEIGRQAYGQQIYQLTDIGLGLEMVRLNAKAILSIGKTPKVFH